MREMHTGIMSLFRCRISLVLVTLFFYFPLLAPSVTKFYFTFAGSKSEEMV